MEEAAWMQFTEVCARDMECEVKVEGLRGTGENGMEVEESERRQTERDRLFHLLTVKSSFNARQCIFIIIHLMESNAQLLVFRLKGCSDLFKLKSGNPKYIN